MSSDMSAEPPSTAAAARSGRYDCPACAAAFNRRQLLRRDLSTGNRWYGKDMGYACPHCKTPLRSRYAASATYIGVTMTWALALLMLQIWKPKKRCGSGSLARLPWDSLRSSASVYGASATTVVHSNGIRNLFEWGTSQHVRRPRAPGEAGRSLSRRVRSRGRPVRLQRRLHPPCVNACSKSA
jgi:hypothetical protein